MDERITHFGYTFSKGLSDQIQDIYFVPIVTSPETAFLLLAFLLLSSQ